MPPDPLLAAVTEALVQAALGFEREHNIPTSHKDLGLAAQRRKELYDAVAKYRAALRGAR